MLQGDGIEPSDFLKQVFLQVRLVLPLQLENDTRSIKPENPSPDVSEIYVGIFCRGAKIPKKKEPIPDSIMRRIHADDIFRKRQRSLRLLVAGHDGAKIGHGFAVFVRVGDFCKRVGAAVILWDGGDVRPFFGVVVFAHYLFSQLF